MIKSGKLHKRYIRAFGFFETLGHKEPLVQIILPTVELQLLGQGPEFVIPDAVHGGHGGREDVDLGGFFHGLDEAEGVVQTAAAAVDAVPGS